MDMNCGSGEPRPSRSLVVLATSGLLVNALISVVCNVERIGEKLGWD